MSFGMVWERTPPISVILKSPFTRASRLLVIAELFEVRCLYSANVAIMNVLRRFSIASVTISHFVVKIASRVMFWKIHG